MDKSKQIEELTQLIRQKDEEVWQLKLRRSNLRSSNMIIKGCPNTRS